MRVTNWTSIAAIAVCLSVSAWAGDGDHGNGRFESDVIGSMPGDTVGGVTSGGAPWVATGHASASSNGRMHLNITGLLIAAGPGVPANLVGTVGPVTMVAVSLVCGGSGGWVAASSDGAPLSSAGDAEINSTVAVPASCVAPTVLVRIFRPAEPVGSQLGPFIALSGFNAGAAAQNDSGHDK